LSRERSTASSIPRPVWIFGWVSLATDAASEAIYSLLPFFLTQVLGATAVSLGVVEGAAEAANSLLKIASGRLADRTRHKRRIVLLGYSISSAVRPLIAFATTWTQVFAVRVADRVGKGVRGAPRDAMLAAWATPFTRGRVYGLQRGMDHLGAVVGPALATLFLVFYPGQYRTLFLWTIVPGAIAVALIFLVPEEGAASAHSARVAPVAPRASAPVAFSAPLAPSTLPRQFHLFIAVLALFMLGNSSDAFLLLRLTDAAGGAKYVPLMWSALHVVKATVSFVSGGWSDRIGRRRVIATGWLVYAAVYGGFAVSSTLAPLLGWFLIYCFYFGFAEGTEKALVADLAPAARRGTAFGIYTAVQGLGALAASVLFGAIWTAYGAPAAFAVGAALALLATALLFIVVPRERTT
jgi:MFS family permease